MPAKKSCDDNKTLLKSLRSRRIRPPLVRGFQLMLIMVIVSLFSLPVQARCSNTSPIASPIFLAFDEYVRANYSSANLKSRSISNAYAYGHALGRLASAVRDDSTRRNAFDCVQLALDKSAFKGTNLPGDAPVAGRWVRVLREASRGMHDSRVRSVFGVTDIRSLDFVFQMAERLGAGSTRISPVIGRGTTTTPLPPRPGLTIRGRNRSCVTGGRWSLRQAARHLRRANTFRRTLESQFGENTYCERDAWFICRNIKRELADARDHINQVFEQNYNSAKQCRLCNFDKSLRAADRLRSWVRWSRSRGLRISAMGNTFPIIESRMRKPLCGAIAGRDPVDVPPPRIPVIPRTVAPIRAGADRCLDPAYPRDADLYGYGFGAGSKVGEMKGEFWCGGRGYVRVTRSEFTYYRCTIDRRSKTYKDCRQTKVENVIESEVNSGKTTYWIKKTPNHKKKYFVKKLR